MKSIYAAIVLTFSAVGLFAQTSVKKVPIYELFSSSTCPPCKPANDHLIPIFQEFEEEVVPIVYHMSWPGTGDPYFTSEGNSRRTYYATNSAPSLFSKGEATAADIYGVSETSIQADIDGAADAEVSMELRFMVDSDNQSIRIRARIEALVDIPDGGHRVYMPVLEHETFNNVKTNGETEFHYVFKKMLPESNGELLIGELFEGEVIEYDFTYAFQGDYRLPNNAGDQIDHDTEHSVEDFEAIYPVMFMTSLVDRRIYQVANAEHPATVEDLERPWGADVIVDPTPPTSVEEFNNGRNMVVYPNPADQVVTIEFARSTAVESISILSLKGELVASETFNGERNRIELVTEHIAPGVYMLDINQEGVHSYERIVVR